MIHDFEIRVRLQAGRLSSPVPPEATTVIEGEVVVTRDERRSGLPERIEPEEHYADVAVEKRVLGRLPTAVESEDQSRRSRTKRPPSLSRFTVSIVSRPRNVARPR